MNDSFVSITAFGCARVFCRGTITQRTTMMILAFLTLLLIPNGSAVGEMVENVTGFVGDDVLLSCGCSNDSIVAWQKGLRVVNAYLQDSTTHIDPAYVDRTELFMKKEKSNCSIMIRNISLEDAGVYTCHAMVNVQDSIWARTPLNVNLTVSENTVSSTQPIEAKDESVNAVSISVPILVLLILGVAAFLTLLIKRRHRTHTDTDFPSQQPMIQSV